MVGNSLSQSRRRMGWGLMASVVGGFVWAATPGLPVIWAPRASAEAKAAGLALFEHEWTAHDTMAGGDGLGPVFNERSCVACHFQGGVGGGGATQHNVVSFELLPTKDRPDMKGGLVHAFAIENKYTEKLGTLREMFPVVPGCIKVEGQCKQVFFHDFDPLRSESVNSPALFGVGWIDRLSGKTIHQLGMRKTIARFGRELTGEFHEGIVPGRPRVLADGRIGKFGWKAQFASLEDFVAAACANEMGLGNPNLEQAKPIGHDYPDVPPDLDKKQFRNLVAYVDTLPRPEAITPASIGDAELARHGEALFNTVGCAVCHTPEIGGLAGVYSDFLLHRLDDRSGGGSEYRTVESIEVPLPEAFPLPEEWKTPPLWGVADSAPYLHNGSARTLEGAILRHRGDAETVYQAYKKLPEPDRHAVLAFLRTLKAPQDVKPAVVAALTKRR